jgi:hypothetical protein
MSDDPRARYAEAKVETIDTATARLPCRRFGSGPALLLVHGFPPPGFTWRKVLPALSARYTCYVPDLPGLGDSERTDRTGFSFPGQGRTLQALVDRLGLDRYSVLAEGDFDRQVIPPLLGSARRMDGLARTMVEQFPVRIPCASSSSA